MIRLAIPILVGVSTSLASCGPSAPIGDWSLDESVSETLVCPSEFTMRPDSLRIGGAAHDVEYRQRDGATEVMNSRTGVSIARFIRRNGQLELDLSTGTMMDEFTAGVRCVYRKA